MRVGSHRAFSFLRAARRWLAVVCLAAAAGFADTVQQLKERDIDLDGGQVKKTLRF